MLKVKFFTPTLVTPIFSDRQTCLNESIHHPKKALPYFKQELKKNNFSNNSHPLLGNIDTFLRDIFERWQTQDMGTNVVAKYLTHTVKPFLIDKERAHFIEQACSLEPRQRQQAQAYLRNNPDISLYRSSLGSLRTLLDEINLISKAKRWNVHDMGANPITAQLQTLISERDAEPSESLELEEIDLYPHEKGTFSPFHSS
jgi:hypothetical protein